MDLVNGHAHTNGLFELATIAGQCHQFIDEPGENMHMKLNGMIHQGIYCRVIPIEPVCGSDRGNSGIGTVESIPIRGDMIQQLHSAERCTGDDLGI